MSSKPNQSNSKHFIAFKINKLLRVTMELSYHLRLSQAHIKAVHGHAQAQALPTLVYGQGKEKDGVHQGWEQCKWPSVWVPVAPGCHRGRGGHIWKGGGLDLASTQ